MRKRSTDREAVDTLKNHFSKVQIADKDADEDRDPYTSTSWDGDSFSNGATGTIDWVVDFGLPEIPREVSLYVSARDAASAGGHYFILFKAKNTTTNESLACICPRSGNDHLGNIAGPVAVAANGTTYYSVTASGVNTMDIWVRVVDWVK